MSRVGPSSKSTAHTIDNALSHFVNQSAHTDPPATATIYRQAIHLFTRFLTQHTPIRPHIDPVSMLSLDIFQAFLSYLQDAYSPETEHAYFRAIIAFATTLTSSKSHSELSSQLTLLAHSDRRKKHKQEPQLPSHDHITAIRDYLHHIALPQRENDGPAFRERLRILRDRALILTLLDTGLKPSEITSLRVAHLQDNSIKLRDISLEIPPQTTLAIRQYLSERAPLDNQQKSGPLAALPLFARHDKRASSHVLAISRWTVANIITYWTNLAIPHGPNPEPDTITPTALRHHFVMSTLTATNDLTLTQQLARHKDKATTRQYLRHQKDSGTD